MEGKEEDDGRGWPTVTSSPTGTVTGIRLIPLFSPTGRRVKRALWNRKNIPDGNEQLAKFTFPVGWPKRVEAASNKGNNPGGQVQRGRPRGI